MTWSTSTLWVDAAAGQTIYRVRTSSGIGAILPAIVAASNADWLQCWEGPESTNTPVPTAAQYLPTKPAALLYFLCGDGSTAILRIPSPQVGIFLADQVTVDPTNALVITLVAACVGSLQSASGSTAVSLQAGVLEGLPQR
jgi:hypothetical protein